MTSTIIHYIELPPTLVFMSFLKNWVKKINQLMFSYKDGFFIFPVLASDPESIIMGFKKTPFVKYFEEKHLAKSRTPFMDAEAYFHKIEDGLWLICSYLRFKKNVCFRVLLDEDNPSPFYTLTINSNLTSSEIIHAKSGQHVERMSFYWELVKPQAMSNDFNYSKTSTRVITIYLHQDWVEAHVLATNLLNKVVLDWFRDPKAEVLLLPHHKVAKAVSIDEMFASLENQQQGQVNVLKLKANVMAFLSAYVEEINQLDAETLRVLDPKNQSNMIRAERILKDAIFTGFPSIAFIAKETGISETKLKSEFKDVFGKTLFQYYSESQMEVAEDMLKSGQQSVKSIAYSLGYTHPGKFSVAFKKIKGISPSEITK